MTFTTPGYEDLELSTQILIKEALARDIAVDVLDRTDNFIRLHQSNKIEYVKQATRTSVDSYISPLIMENKLVTCKILRENNIHTPVAVAFEDLEQAMGRYSDYQHKHIVIKPKSTNFGLGVHILHDNTSANDFKEAVTNAFNHDSAIIIEPFFSGKEYRFLVINNEVIGVLHRVPANVTGDGEQTIEALVAQKNLSPLRGTGYKKPLEKISLGETEKSFLSDRGLTIHDIPPKNKTRYLRENSNISTGGDSIDYTDKMPDCYKQIAIKAASAVGARICGADIIIPDITTDPGDTITDAHYVVIELNFNPALHMHEFPWIGTRRFSEKKILTLLGF